MSRKTSSLKPDDGSRICSHLTFHAFPTSRASPWRSKSNNIRTLVLRSLPQSGPSPRGGAVSKSVQFVPDAIRLFRLTARPRVRKQQVLAGPVGAGSATPSRAVKVRFPRGKDEGVRLANNTEYGVAAYVFTRDLNRGIWMGERSRRQLRPPFLHPWSQYARGHGPGNWDRRSVAADRFRQAKPIIASNALFPSGACSSLRLPLRPGNCL